ncbi:hypothetical protein DVH24_010135 [Malus domestica]|uniref:C-JID domain-containing protein n=1 Tax=Malus domestica TaxID=3750 RepID=A0A498JQU5_MALDO|nr:hypothetical protein DVH24_010135 [Malus domestica]
MLKTYIFIFKLCSYCQETPRVQAVRVDLYIIQERPLKRADFKLMSDLRLLIVNSYDKFISSIELPDSLCYLYWYGYPLESLPSNFFPENLVELHLPYSKVKKLWKEDQINLSGRLKIVEINLSGCQSLVEIPLYFQHLDKLTHLDLRDCRSLKYLPEMPGNLKCLKCTGCRKLKKLPSSSVGFISLEELELSYSSILEIPASIKQASRLSILDLRWCQRLQSIPELPVLCNVKAEGCTSLKIVSSSRTALAQGWDKPNYCYRVFTNCPKLDNNSRSNIMDEAQIAIMRMATVAPLKYPPLPQNPRPQINFVCRGKAIPNWFSYQNEGSSVNIDLPPDWFRTSLFGFALSVVVSGVSQVRYDLRRVRANFIVIFMGECHKLFSSKYIIPDNSYDDDYFDGLNHVHVWNEAFRSEEVGKNCSPDVYKLAKEASLVFYPVDLEERPDSASHMKVESCGICPLYAEDAEKFKFDHVFMSREPKVEETRQDDDSGGGGSRDEPEASGSSDESEANESDDHGSEASGTENDSDF